MEVLILVVTVLVCAFLFLASVGLLVTRVDTLKNLNKNNKLIDISAKRLTLLRMYLKNSGLKRNAEKYLEYDSNGPIFYEEKDEFVRKLVGDRTLRFQINCILVCMAILWLTHSAVLTGVLFFFYLLCSLNDPLYARIIVENPGVLVQNEI